MNFIRKSLGAKVLVLTTILTFAAFLGLFLANSYWQRQSIIHEIEYNARQTSEMLQLGIEEPMRIGDNEATVAQFESINENNDKVEIYMTNYRGNVTYSTEAATVREDLSTIFANEDLIRLMETSLAGEMQHGEIMELAGKPRFVEIKSIPNQTECYHCHGSSKPIIGSMIELQDISNEMNNLRSSQYKSAAISLVGMLALLASLLLFMRIAIISRIRTIVQASEQVSEGDFETSFAVKGNDEMADLSEHLNEMVGQIKNQMEYINSVLNGIIIPLLVVDENRRIEFVNSPMLNILGRKKSDTLQKPLNEVLVIGENGQDAIPEVISTGLSKSGLMRYRRSDGTEFPLHFEISALRNAAGENVGAICVMIDLTQEEQDRERIENHRVKLLDVANQVTSVALKLNDAATAISGQMDELTRGVDNTSDRTAQVATAMEEMNASVLEIAQNASQTSTSSTTAKEVASKGGQEVGETLAITRDVVSTTERLATVMNDLAERAENIGQVLSVINDIADQTNLLALNAAIEAARAGEAGRGFAVVADEVRKLAEKTMSATKEVHEAVAQIQDGTQKAVGEMDATREQVSKAADMAEQAGQILENIIEQSDSIAEMVSGIAVASEEQSATSDEINSNVNTINQVSADLSERIQQANTEIHEVAAMASNLTELVAGFREQEEEEDTRQIARERRKHERFLLKVFGHEKPCTIQTSAGASYKASLIDVSRGGVRVKLADGAVPLEQGDKIRFFSSLRHDDFRLDDFSARIKWVIDNECGMEFDALLPVDVSTIQAMLME